MKRVVSHFQQELHMKGRPLRNHWIPSFVDMKHDQPCENEPAPQVPNNWGSSGPAIFLPKIWVVPFWGYPFHWEGSAWLMDFLELSQTISPTFPDFHDGSCGGNVGFMMWVGDKKLLTTRKGHGQSGWSSIGCEGFHTNLNIPSPLPTTLVFRWFCWLLIYIYTLHYCIFLVYISSVYCKSSLHQSNE